MKIRQKIVITLVVISLCENAFAFGEYKANAYQESYAQKYQPQQAQGFWAGLSARWQASTDLMRAVIRKSDSYFSPTRKERGYFPLVREILLYAIDPLTYVLTRRSEAKVAVVSALTAVPDTIRKRSTALSLPMAQTSCGVVLFAASAAKGLSLSAELVGRGAKAVGRNIAQYAGLGGSDAYPCVVRRVGSAGNIAVADMTLDFYNPQFSKGMIVGDLRGIVVGNIRWAKAVQTGAAVIAKVLERGYAIVHVPGVNSAGLTDAQLLAILKTVKLPKGSTLVLLHSAGTDSGVRGMKLYKGDPNKLYVLIVSPRMGAGTYEKYLAAAHIPPSHVITVNSPKDYPHWPSTLGMQKFPVAQFVWGCVVGQPLMALAAAYYGNLLYNAWHGYDTNRGTGTHIEIKELKIGNQVQKIDHGGIIDALATSARGRFVVNGTTEYNNVNYANLISEIFGEDSEKN